MLFGLIRCPDMQMSEQKYLKSFTVLLNNYISVMGTKRKRNNAVEVINSNRARAAQRKKVSFFESSQSLRQSKTNVSQIWNPVFHYRIPKISPLDHRLNRINRLTNSYRILYKFSYFALYARSFKVLRNKSFYTFLISHMHAYLIERDRFRQENFVDFNGKWDEGVSWIQMALIVIRWSILWKM
jgi:hypothetical protein